MSRVMFSAALSYLIQQSLGILPAQAGIRDGFAVYMIVDSLAAFLDIAFDHDAFYQTADVLGVGAAVQHFLDDTDLLFKLLVGIVVVCVYDAGRILQLSGVVEVQKMTQVLVVVIGQG